MSRHVLFSPFFGLCTLFAATACTVDNPAFEPPAAVCAGGETYVRQAFQLADPNRVDILFVVDNGPGMADAQQRLGASMPILVNALNAEATLDWQLAVTTTDVTGLAGELVYGGTGINGCPALDSAIITRTTPDAAFAAECAVQVGDEGSDFEQGFQAARFALSERAFGRPEARRIVVFFSNEDDCSATASFNQGSPDNCRSQQNLLFSVDEFRRYFATLQSRSGDALTFVSIVAGTGDATDAIQCGDQDSAFAGNRYSQLSAGFGRLGQTLSICSQSFDDAITSLAQDVALAPDDQLCLTSTLSREPTDVVLRPTENGEIASELSAFGQYLNLGATSGCPTGAVSISRTAHNSSTGQRLEVWFCTSDAI
jgi:hypothetical protein